MRMSTDMLIIELTCKVIFKTSTLEVPITTAVDNNFILKSFIFYIIRFDNSSELKEAIKFEKCYLLQIVADTLRV